VKKLIILMALLLGQTVYGLTSQQQKLVKNLQNGTEQEIAEILKAITDVNFVVNEGRTPLIYAAAYRNIPAVTLLLQKGAIIDIGDVRGKTALIYAAKNSNDTAELLTILINAGANINQPDNNKWTPLMHAARTGHANNVKKLLDLGADEMLQDNNGNTALMHAVIGADEGDKSRYKEQIKDLSQKLIVVNLKNNDELTAAKIAEKLHLLEFWNEFSEPHDFWDDLNW